MQTSDIIKPIWNNIASIIPWRDGEAGGTIESPVPATMIGAVIGKTIDISYQVERDGRTYFSDTFNLTVGPIPQESLPKPQIPQASGDVLDLNTFAGDADLTVQPWPFIAVGQKIWMRLEGLKNPDLPAWQEYEITSPGTQSTKVPRTDLEGLDDASTLRLVLEVSFDGGLTRKEFPAQNYQIKKAPQYVVETFSDYGPGPVDSPLDTTHIIFTGSGMSIDHSAGKTSVLNNESSGANINMQLKSDCSEVWFVAYANGVSGNQVRLTCRYGEGQTDNKLIGVGPWGTYKFKHDKIISFTAKRETGIGWINIDSIRLYKK